MVHDVRWQQRLGSFRLSLNTLDEVYHRWTDHPLDRVEVQAFIKSFELSYETGWKLLKDWLEYQGVSDISGARDAIRAAVNLGLIHDRETWMEMVGTRSRTVYTYNESVAREVEQRIAKRFHPVLHALLLEMSRRATAEHSDAPSDIGTLDNRSGSSGDS